MNKEEMIKLLVLAKVDKFAEQDLLEEIRTHIMPRRISRFINRNRQVDNDDVRQEYMIGVAMAIKSVNLETGDPIEYILNNGIYRVRSYVRGSILKATMQVCKDCGHKSRLNKTQSGYACKCCGGTNIETSEVNDYDETKLSSVQVDGFSDDVIANELITSFKSTLQPGTNVYKLYEELVEHGLNRDNPMVKNYMKAIADKWGCSTQNINQNMKKLQLKYAEFAESNDLMTPVIA